MILNIKLSKALPERAINYAIDKNLLDNPIKRNIFSEKHPISEMKETASKYGKWSNREERKTFSIIISPNPKDRPTEDQVLEVSQAILDKFFPTIQGFLVLHKDKGMDAQKANPVLHSHFYGSIIDPITGRNIHLSNRDIKGIREWADSYAHEHFGWKAFVKEKRGDKRYGKLMMQKMIRSGRDSWMERLTEVVEDAYNTALSFKDFERRLRNQGVEMENADGTGQLRFQLNVEGKDIKVNATAISRLLTWNALSEKFTEIEKEDKDGSKGVKSWNKKEVQVGAGSHQGRTTTSAGGGTCGGTGSVGSHGRKINYGCIICTRDKGICRKCIEFKKERGEYTHGSRTR